VTASDPEREHYAYLMAFARGEPNDDALACMLATRHAGGGALPERSARISHQGSSRGVRGARGYKARA